MDNSYVERNIINNSQQGASIQIIQIRGLCFLPEHSHFSSTQLSPLSRLPNCVVRCQTGSNYASLELSTSLHIKKVIGFVLFPPAGLCMRHAAHVWIMEVVVFLSQSFFSFLILQLLSIFYFLFVFLLILYMRQFLNYFLLINFSFIFLS